MSIPEVISSIIILYCFVLILRIAYNIRPKNIWTVPQISLPYFKLFRVISKFDSSSTSDQTRSSVLHPCHMLCISFGLVLLEPNVNGQMEYRVISRPPTVLVHPEVQI